MKPSSIILTSHHPKLPMQTLKQTREELLGMGRSQGYIQHVPQPLEHQPALGAVSISRPQAPTSSRATRNPCPDVFLHHSPW